MAKDTNKINEEKIATSTTQAVSKIKKIICLTHKGGAGKSTLSQFVLPFYFHLFNNGGSLNSLPLKIYEIEAKNPSREHKYKDSCVDYNYHRLSKEEDIQNIFTDALFDDEDYYIFDVGGSEVTTSTIQHLLRADTEAEGYLFVIPFILSEDYFLSAINTYSEIIKLNPDANILFVATKIPLDYRVKTDSNKYLSDDELFRELEMSKQNINIEYLKDKNLSYIPIFLNTLRNEALFNEDGCCLDVVRDFINGKTVRDLTLELKEQLSITYQDKEQQKEQYKIKLAHINKKFDLYTYLDYCKPLFDKIKSFN